MFNELDELDEEFEGSLQISRVQNIRVAARREDLETLMFLVDKEHQNPLQKDQIWRYCSSCSCTRRKFRLAQVLHQCERLKPCMSRLYLGGTPLHVATENDCFDVIKYLVTEQQVQPLCQDEGGVTPLHISSERGCLEIVNFLLRRLNKYEPLKDLMPSLTTRRRALLYTLLH